LQCHDCLDDDFYVGSGMEESRLKLKHHCERKNIIIFLPYSDVFQLIIMMFFFPQ